MKMDWNSPGTRAEKENHDQKNKNEKSEKAENTKIRFIVLMQQ